MKKTKINFVYNTNKRKYFFRKKKKNKRRNKKKTEKNSYKEVFVF